MIPGFLYGALLIVVVVLALLYYRARRKLLRYQQYYDGTLAPVIRLELDRFQPISCSPSFASLLGYSSPAECIALFWQYAHLRGQGFQDLYALAPEKVVAVEMVNRSGEIVASEVDVFIADGADFMELRVLSGQDTADKVHIRQSLVPCIQMDPQLTIIACNEAARNLFGWGDALVAGKHLGSLLFPPADRERLASIHLRRVTRKGQSKLRHLTLIGDDEYAECQWQLVREGNRVYAFCIIDSRDRHISRSLLDSNTSTLMHHDLANHLASVTGYAGLVSESEALPEPLANYVREISKAGYKARALLQGREAGVESAGGLLDEIDNIATDFNIPVAHRIADTVCLIDSNDIRAILEPLLKNALESGSDIDSITIETSRAHMQSGICSACGEFGAADFLTLQVRDRGEGITPDHLAWIFTAGFTTRRIGGDRETGLAAVSCRVHEWGGHLRVESVTGKGTSVSLYLPAGDRGPASGSDS